MTKQIITERAHYMCPNMHFGLAIEIKKPFDEGRIAETMNLLKKVHPQLASLVAEDENGNPVYERKDEVSAPVYVKKNPANWLADYQEVTAEGWDLRSDCLLRLIAYAKEDSTFIVFAAHHLLCDGMGLLQLATAFADYYAYSKEPAKREDRLIESVEEFGDNFKVSFIVKTVANSANKKWLKEGQKKLTYDAYREFEKEFYKKDTVTRTTGTIAKGEMSSIVAKCKKEDITVNDYLVADMMVLDKTRKVIVGTNVRKLLRKYEYGAIGNFSSAYSIEVRKSGDVWTIAKAVSRITRRFKNNPGMELTTLALYSALDQNLLDAAPASALGGFESEAGLFVGDRLLGMKKQKNYTITNLGKIESVAICDAYFVPPCSPSAKKIVGVVTVNGVMNKVECDRGTGLLSH